AGVTSAQISKAYLKVYATAVTGQGTFDLYQIISAWQEGTVTYNTKPSMTLVTSGTTCPSGTQCINAASKYYQVDITSLVQGWLNAPATNFGLALKPNTTTISATLESKESTTTSHAPEVDVVLTPGTGGTVTSIGTGAGLTGGVITTSGTISLVPPTGSNLGGVKGPNCGAGNHFSGIAVDGTLSCSADSVSSIACSAIASGTNTTGAMIVGNGSTLTPGGGTITANALSGGTYAINITGSAGTAGSAANFTGALAGDVTGTQGATVVSKIGGVSASNFARLDIGNSFNGNQSIMGGKQTLAPSLGGAGGYASLKFPNAGTTPSSPAVGDLWLTTGDLHLQFRSDATHTQSLAFLSDITGGNNTYTGNNTFSGNNSFTGTNTFAGINATSLSASGTVTAGSFTGPLTGNVTGNVLGNLTGNVTGNLFGNADTATLAANASLLSGEAAATAGTGNTIAARDVSGDLFANAFHGSGAALTNLDAGNIATGTLGDARLSNNVALTTRANTFGAGNKQTVQSNADFAGLNIAGFASNPTNNPLVPGDVWFNTADNHVLFRDNNNATQSLAFLSDITGGNNTYSGNNTFTGNNSLPGTNPFAGINATSWSASGTVTAGSFSGPLTGNVTGNLTGNVLGNVTGNVTGNLFGNADTATLAANASLLSGEA